MESHMLNTITRKLEILMLEDDPADAELIRRMLCRSELDFSATLVSDEQAFVTAISTTSFDIILCDNSLPQFNSVRALEMKQEWLPDASFILVTGSMSDEFAVDIIHKGADDYILKSNLKRLPSAIAGALEKQQMRKEKMLAEEALRESEQNYRILFEQASDGIVIANREGRLTDVNTKACQMTGYSATEMMRLTIADVFFDGDIAINPIRFEELQAGKTILSERRVKRKDGTSIDTELNAKMLPDGRMLAIARDVTYRKKLEAQLLTEKIRQQKKMVQATVDAQEKERTEIGKELHDNINQILASTKLFLNAAENDASIKDSMIRRSEANIVRAIDEIRKLSKSLVTPALEELDLIESIQGLMTSIQLTTPLNLQFRVQPSDMTDLSSRQQVALYRIVQEQLNNIIKHAGASNVEVVLEKNDAYIHLVVSDDGKGFNPGAKSRGIGLSNMQSRAELLNGTLTIRSDAGKGCQIKVILPVDEPVVSQNDSSQYID